MEIVRRDKMFLNKSIYIRLFEKVNFIKYKKYLFIILKKIQIIIILKTFFKKQMKGFFLMFAVFSRLFFPTLQFYTENDNYESFSLPTSIFFLKKKNLL